MPDYDNAVHTKQSNKSNQLENSKRSGQNNNQSLKMTQRVQDSSAIPSCYNARVLQRKLGNRAVIQLMGNYQNQRETKNANNNGSSLDRDSLQMKVDLINQNNTGYFKENTINQGKSETLQKCDEEATQLKNEKDTELPNDMKSNVENNLIIGNTNISSSTEAPIQRMLVGIEMETVVPIFQKGVRPDHVDGYIAQANDYDHENVDETLRQPLGSGFEIHVDSNSIGKNGAMNRISPSTKLHIMEMVSTPVASREAFEQKLQIAKNFLTVLESYRVVTGEDYSVGWPIPNQDFQLDDKTFTIAEMEKVFSADYNGSLGILYDAAAQLTFQTSPDSLERINDNDIFERNTGRKETVTSEKTGKSFKVPIKERHPLVDRKSMAEAMLLDTALDNEYVRRLVDVTVKIFKDTLKLVNSGVSGTVKNAVTYLVRSDLKRLFPSFPAEIARSVAQDVAIILRLTKFDELNIPKAYEKDIYDRKRDAIKLNSSTFKTITDPDEREKGELEHINASLRESLTRTVEDGKLWPWRDAMEWLGDEVGKIFIQESDDVTGPLHGSANLSLLSEANRETEVDDLKVIEGVSREWLDHPEVNDYPDEVLEVAAPKKDREKEGLVVEDRTQLDIKLDSGGIPDNIVRRMDLIGFPE